MLGQKPEWNGKVYSQNILYSENLKIFYGNHVKSCIISTIYNNQGVDCHGNLLHSVQISSNLL